MGSKLAHELGPLDVRKKTPVLSIRTFRFLWGCLPRNPKVSDSLFGFFFGTTVITGKGRLGCHPRKGGSLGFGSGGNILGCRCLPSADPVSLKCSSCRGEGPTNGSSFLRFSWPHSAVDHGLCLAFHHNTDVPAILFLPHRLNYTGHCLALSSNLTIPLWCEKKLTVSGYLARNS